MRVVDIRAASECDGHDSGPVAQFKPTDSKPMCATDTNSASAV